MKRLYRCEVKLFSIYKADYNIQCMYVRAETSLCYTCTYTVSDAYLTIKQYLAPILPTEKSQNDVLTNNTWSRLSQSVALTVTWVQGVSAEKVATWSVSHAWRVYWNELNGVLGHICTHIG